MASLNIKNSFSIAVRGREIEGWQGTDSANDADDAFTVTVDGKVLDASGVLATGSGRTIFDNSSSYPASWDFFFINSDQDLDVQLIGSTLNATVHLKAGIPLVIAYQHLLAAIDTTVQTGGATPGYETIAKINISNRSGTDANYVAFGVD